MSIATFHLTTKVASVHVDSNKNFSYVMEIFKGKHLLHRYWGKSLKEFHDSAPLQKVDRGFSGQLNDFENERTVSIDVLPQEFPVRSYAASYKNILP